MDAELVGEVFGGTLASAMAGGVADRYGLAAPLWIAAAGAATVICAGMFLPELRLADWHPRVVDTKPLNCRTEN